LPKNQRSKQILIMTSRGGGFGQNMAELGEGGRVKKSAFWEWRISAIASYDKNNF